MPALYPVVPASSGWRHLTKGLVRALGCRHGDVNLRTANADEYDLVAHKEVADLKRRGASTNGRLTRDPTLSCTCVAFLRGSISSDTSAVTVIGINVTVRYVHTLHQIF